MTLYTVANIKDTYYLDHDTVLLKYFTLKQAIHAAKLRCFNQSCSMEGPGYSISGN